MKTKITLAVLTIALAGCATTDELMKKAADATGMSQSTTGAVGGAAIGAVAGSVAGRVLGVDRTTSAAIGAAIGGWLGYKQGASADLAAAKAAQAKLEASGIKATVETQEVVFKNDGPSPVSATQAERKETVLKRFSAPLPAVALRKQDKDAAGVLEQAGAMAASSSAPTTVYVIAPDKKSADWSKARVLDGAKGKEDVRVVAIVGKETGFAVSPDYSTMVAAR